MKTKVIVIILAAACLFLAAGVAFNVLEMNEYDLFNSLIERFSK